MFISEHDASRGKALLAVAMRRFDFLAHRQRSGALGDVPRAAKKYA